MAIRTEKCGGGKGGLERRDMELGRPTACRMESRSADLARMAGSLNRNIRISVSLSSMPLYALVGGAPKVRNQHNIDVYRSSAWHVSDTNIREFHYEVR